MGGGIGERKRFQAGSFGYFFYFILFFIGLKYLFLTTMSQNFWPGDNEHKLFGGDGFSLPDQSYTHLSPRTCRIFRLIDLCGYPVTQHNPTLSVAYTTYAWQNEYIFRSCHLVGIIYNSSSQHEEENIRFRSPRRSMFTTLTDSSSEIFVRWTAFDKTPGSFGTSWSKKHKTFAGNDFRFSNSWEVLRNLCGSC